MVPEYRAPDIREVIERPYRIIYRIRAEQVDVLAEYTALSGCPQPSRLGAQTHGGDGGRNEEQNNDKQGRGRHSRDGTVDDPTTQGRPTCFVIQPFDQGSRFDKGYQDAFEPALAEAGLDAYRVDQDPNAEVLIDAIEKGIRRAPICLADVTTDNPNVWFELGFAYAARKSVILICGDERKGALPFDIQHRNVIQYKSESGSDFEVLKRQITERAKALLERAIEKQMNDADPIAPQAGLSQREIQLLGVLAGATPAPGTRESVWSLRRNAVSVGLTPIAMGII